MIQSIPDYSVSCPQYVVPTKKGEAIIRWLQTTNTDGMTNLERVLKAYHTENYKYHNLKRVCINLFEMENGVSSIGSTAALAGALGVCNINRQFVLFLMGISSEQRILEICRGLSGDPHYVSFIGGIRPFRGMKNRKNIQV